MLNEIIIDEETTDISHEELMGVYKLVEENEGDWYLTSTFSVQHKLSYRSILFKFATIVDALRDAEYKGKETPYEKLPPHIRFSDDDIQYFKKKARIIISEKHREANERVAFAKLILKFITTIQEYSEDNLKARYKRQDDYPMLSELPRTDFEKKVDEFLGVAK